MVGNRPVLWLCLSVEGLRIRGPLHSLFSKYLDVGDAFVLIRVTGTPLIGID